MGYVNKGVWPWPYQVSGGGSVPSVNLLMWLLHFNSLQVFPSCIRLVVDVSGSMYRFNGYDGRLDRMVEAVLMVMEACQNLNNYRVKHAVSFTKFA